MDSAKDEQIWYEQSDHITDQQSDWQHLISWNVCFYFDKGFLKPLWVFVVQAGIDKRRTGAEAS